MRRRVCIVSKARDGTIVGMHAVDRSKPEGEGAPSGLELTALPGQRLDTVDLPAPLRQLAPHELVKRFRMKSGRLVEVGKH
jgi:hypothetical protein